MKENLFAVCPFCGKKSILLDYMGPEELQEGMTKLKEGKSVQDAFPKQPPEVRELFITGLCKECFASI